MSDKERGNLLDSIEAFKKGKLKKTETNDRSGPVLDKRTCLNSVKAGKMKKLCRDPRQLSLGLLTAHFRLSTAHFASTSRLFKMLHYNFEVFSEFCVVEVCQRRHRIKADELRG